MSGVCCSAVDSIQISVFFSFKALTLKHLQFEELFKEILKTPAVMIMKFGPCEIHFTSITRPLNTMMLIGISIAHYN